jgi:hypothetical protein
MSWFNTEMRGKWKAPTEHICSKYNIVSKSSSLPAFNTRQVQQKDFRIPKLKQIIQLDKICDKWPIYGENELYTSNSGIQ